MAGATLVADRVRPLIVVSVDGGAHSDGGVPSEPGDGRAAGALTDEPELCQRLRWPGSRQVR